MRAHRNLAIVEGTAVALVIGAVIQAEPVSGHRYALLGAVAHGLLPGLAGAAVWLLLFSRWVRWSGYRGMLALTGRLPWRLAAFLADAQSRGVLRRIGPAYQFRHLRLQEHLGTRRSSQDSHRHR